MIEDYDNIPAVTLPKNTPPGTDVIVTRDDGLEFQTVTKSEPWRLADGRWVIRLRGVSGWYDLNRVRLASPLSLPCRNCPPPEVLAALRDFIVDNGWVNLSVPTELDLCPDCGRAECDENCQLALMRRWLEAQT